MDAQEFYKVLLDINSKLGGLTEAVTTMKKSMDDGSTRMFDMEKRQDTMESAQVAIKTKVAFAGFVAGIIGTSAANWIFHTYS